MSKNNKLQLLTATVVLFVVLFAVCLFALIKGADQRFLNSADIISSQIGNLIESNKGEKTELEKSLKDEYVSRAKALAYILEKDPLLEEDYDELCRVSSLLNIDEVNVFGTDGAIAYSTVPDYVGFSIYSGGQIAFFEPMMEDHSLELCQDMTPNTKEGKLIMYAAVWRSDGDSIVQIGITPEHLLEALERDDISNVLNDMPLENAMYFIYDTSEDRIVSSTEESLFGKSDAETPIAFKGGTDKIRKIKVDDTGYVYTLRNYGQYTIGLCEYTSHLYRDVKTNILILSVFLLGGLGGILFLFYFLSGRERKTEEKYVSGLKDFSDQLSNYKRAILSDALISLEVNLSRDELYYGVWKDDDGNEIPLSEILGLDLPCSYDEYIKKWNERFVKENLTVSFSDQTDREHLISVFENGSADVTFDYEAATISGRSTWLRRTISMTKNRAGDVIAYTSVKDVSALLEQNKQAEKLVTALSTEYDSIAVVNIQPDKYDDQVVLHSRLTEELAARIDEETIKETAFTKKLGDLVKFIHPDDRDAFYENTRRENIFTAFNEYKTHVVTFRLGTSDDSCLFYQMRFAPIRNDAGTIAGIIVGLRNINDEIRKERSARSELEAAKIAAEAASQAKTTFLFNMSHDIRTPMNAIIGFTEIAQKHIDDTERVRESLTKVRMSSEHLLSLINDVLDMSRIESDRVRIEEEPVCVDTANDNLYSILNGSAEARNLTLTCTVSDSVKHRWIYADRLRMMRVFTNVVSNSVKYTNPGGHIDFTVEELPAEREGYAKIVYTVADTGIGMTKEFLSTIFEPFSRAESATKSGVIGTGLGMAITKSLVELMGGTIAIESEVGVGTTVSMTFEHKIAEEVLPEVPAEEIVFALAGRKVLLVEDNELNREIAVDILSEENMVVDTAEDGDVAVEKMRTAEEGQYDLILMDIQMPRMNGYDATRAIRALPNEYAAKIPIIAMTANAFAEDKQNALNAGMNGHIAKPVDVQKLLGTLVEVLK